MGCTCVNLISIFLCALAVVFSCAAIIVPSWSATDAPDDSGRISKASITLGVWGLCVHENVNHTNKFIAFENCYTYFGEEDHDGLHNESNLVIISKNRSRFELQPGICSSKAYSHEISIITSIPIDIFSDYVADICSGYGNFLFFSTVATIILGFTSLIFAILNIMYYSRLLWISRAAMTLSGMAAYAGAISWILWINLTSRLLSFGISLGVALFFQVWSSALHSASIVAFVIFKRRYVAKQSGHAPDIEFESLYK